MFVILYSFKFLRNFVFYFAFYCYYLPRDKLSYHFSFPSIKMQVPWALRLYGLGAAFNELKPTEFL